MRARDHAGFRCISGARRRQHLRAYEDALGDLYILFDFHEGVRLRPPEDWGKLLPMVLALFRIKATLDEPIHRVRTERNSLWKEPDK